MCRDREEHLDLFHVIQQAGIASLVVDYLKTQQAKNQHFFDLLLDNKINGRLFYNTCQPNGEKEVRLGNEAFQQEAFQRVVDDMLAPFSFLAAHEVISESMRPTTLSDKMNFVITSMLSHIESSPAWQQFWEHGILVSDQHEKKKALYNMVASHAAYKALVACVDHSSTVLDPVTKRSVTALIDLCSAKYASPFLCKSDAFALNNRQQDEIAQLETAGHEEELKTVSSVC